MQEKQARDVIKKMLAIWPQIGAYFKNNVNPNSKAETHARWVAALMRRELEHVEAILNEWEFIRCDSSFVCQPVQTICEMADAYARRIKQKPRHEPPNRTQRESNLSEIYDLGRAAVAAGEDLGPILERVL